jgi:hypothetical protein
MDEFLRSASHEIVTGALLVIWGGLLFGMLWKIFELAWKSTTRLFTPREPVPFQIREVFLEHPRIAATVPPVLETGGPTPLLDEAIQPLLPVPPQAPHSLFIPLFQKHKEPQ